MKAQLQGAHLLAAQLQEATLVGAQLQGANLRYTDLRGANLERAQLQGATLAEVKNLTQDQVNMACVDEDTKLPEGLTKPPSCPANP